MSDPAPIDPAPSRPQISLVSSGSAEPYRRLAEIFHDVLSEQSLDALLERIADALAVLIPYEDVHIYEADEAKRELSAVLARGDWADEVMSESFSFGEGITGMVAEARQAIRISGLMRGMLYAYAMHREAQDPAVRQRRIPIPGLEQPESLLGVPLLIRDELVGVLCLESEVPYRFHEEDKASIELLGSYLAIAIQNMQMREHLADEDEATETASAAQLAPVGDDGEPREIVFYASDECIMIDGEYLIRSLPARILWKLLTVHDQTGRTEFTNRELRLDKSLNLPEFKDNLESRLLLLRRRLEQKSPGIRLVPRARGRFALELSSAISLGRRD